MGITECQRWYTAWQDRTRILLLKHLSKIKRMVYVQCGSTDSGVDQSWASWGVQLLLGPFFPPLR